MSRQPVHLSPIPPRQLVWDRIRELRQFCAPQLAGKGVTPGIVRDYLRCLEAARIIRRFSQLTVKIGDARAVRQPMVYQLIDDRGHDAPRVDRDGNEVTQGRSREQMWRTMKMLGQFTPGELALNASTEEHPVAESDAVDYVKNLVKAGYLILADAHRPGVKGRARYRFVPSRNTGPKAPMVQRLSTVYDPNERRIVWHSEVDE